MLLNEVERFVDGTRALIRTTGPLSWGALESLVRRAVDSLAIANDLFWTALMPSTPLAVDPLARHQARTSILALRLASNLGTDGDRLLQVGMAALLCDVGLWARPGVNREGVPIDPTVDRDHVRRSSDLIRGWSPPSDTIVTVVSQHHERENGQGYPQGLRGASIHAHAKIVGLADTYARLTITAAGGPRRDLYKAMRELKELRDDFSPTLIKGLLEEVSLFPLRTVVRLSTGEVGRVVLVNRNHPMRPRVEVLRDAKGDVLAEPRILDLRAVMAISITGVVEDSLGEMSAQPTGSLRRQR